MIDHTVVARTRLGEKVSGDSYAVVPSKDGVLIAVVDALGHGVEASHIAETVIRTVRAQADDEWIASIMWACHEALIGTRGAVLALAFFNGKHNTLTWMGVGNVHGILLRAGGGQTPKTRHMVQRSGVVGDRVPGLTAEVLHVAPRDCMVFATDGVAPSFDESVCADEAPQTIAHKIMDNYSVRGDDALTLVARYLGPDGKP